MQNNDTLGKRLKAIRELCNLSQREMAQSVGISSAGYWSALERDEKTPSSTVLMLIGLKHDVSYKWLLAGEGEMRGAAGTEARAPEIIQSERPESKLSESVESNSDIKALIKEALNEEKAGEHTHKLILAYLEELLTRTASSSPWAKESFQIRRTGERSLESTEMNIKIPGPPADLDKDGRYYWQKNAEALERWAATPGAIKAFPKRTVPAWTIERFLRETRHMYEGGSIADVSGVLWDLIEEGPRTKK